MGYRTGASREAASRWPAWKWEIDVPNLSLKNVPPDLYERLRRSAQEHRRSLNSEILYTLEEAFRSPRIDPVRFLEEVSTLQRKVKVRPLTDDFLRKAKEEGRR